MMGGIVHFVQHKPDESIVWAILKFHEQKPTGTDGKPGNTDLGQTHPGHLSIS